MVVNKVDEPLATLIEQVNTKLQHVMIAVEGNTEAQTKIYEIAQLLRDYYKNGKAQG